MKKKFKLLLCGAVMATIFTVSVKESQKKTFDDLNLSNVEALSQSPEGGEYVAYVSIKEIGSYESTATDGKKYKTITYNADCLGTGTLYCIQGVSSKVEPI